VKTTEVGMESDSRRVHKTSGRDSASRCYHRRALKSLVGMRSSAQREDGQGVLCRTGDVPMVRKHSYKAIGTDIKRTRQKMS